jgi:hypothetical protein
MDLERRGLGFSPELAGSDSFNQKLSSNGYNRGADSDEQQTAATASGQLELSTVDDQQGSYPGKPLNIRPPFPQVKRSSKSINYLPNPSPGESRTPIQTLEGSLRRPENQSIVTNAMMGAMPNSSQDQEFFGTSSASSFVKEVKSFIDTSVGSQEDVEQLDFAFGREELSIARAEREPQQNVDSDYSLPPRKMADSLMNVYWELVHPLYPFLDREEMEIAYQSLWKNDGPVYDESIDLCILNIIFALSCQLSPLINQRKEEHPQKCSFHEQDISSTMTCGRLGHCLWYNVLSFLVYIFGVQTIHINVGLSLDWRFAQHKVSDFISPEIIYVLLHQESNKRCVEFGTAAS